MITIKSHFAFSGINIPSTINCSINSYFKDDQLIQQINFPITPITEPLGQNYIKSIINNNLKTLDNNLTELAGLHLITISTGTPLKIYQHLIMGDTLTYHESDFNYYITYSQYLD